MKKLIIALLIVISVFIFAACSKSNEGSSTTQPSNIIFEVKDQNFHVKTYINKLEFSKNEEIKWYSTIEYIGPEETIKIWSGEPYFHHTIYDGKEYYNSPMTLDILKNTVLKKGEVYTIPFTKSGGFDENDPKADFWRQYFAEKELKLPSGKYTFTAATDFTLDMEQKDRVKLKNEFEVAVK